MRDWSKFSRQSFLGRLIRLPLDLVPKRMTVRIMSGPCRGMKWVSGAGVLGYWSGLYESQTQQLISQFLKPGMTVYDVGANVGFYTLLMSRATGLRGRVYAFEPMPGNTAVLLHHVHLNSLGNVTLVAAAVFSEETVRPFQEASSNAQGFISDEASGALLVPTVSLDQFIARGRPTPDLVKMDIEGGETAALEGARELVKKRRTVWFISLHNDPARDQWCQALTTNHYRLIGMDGRPIGDLKKPLSELCAIPES
jgi:FkbM family methyltransferase